MPEINKAASSSTENQAVTNFREYLRIKTVQPNPDYDGALVFLEKMAKQLDLPYKMVEVHPGRVVFYMTWEGEDPTLKSILLNSHIDVVPVYPESWKVDPFSAHKMENGDIYARGTQDMKCVGMQYVEAIRRLKQEGKRLKRTVYVTFVPDEEIGGFLGMNLFVKTEDFKKMNVGFALDEGLANPTEAFTVFYGERCPWWVQVRCPGNPGHGSRFIENNAGEKVRRIINSFLEFRGQEEKKLKTNGCLKLGDVTTVNLTMLEGGVQMNVVPGELKVGFDIRIAPTVDLVAFEEKIKSWCNEAGEDVTVKFLQKEMCQNTTSTDSSDVWWNAFSTTCEKMGIKVEKEIFPAFTDIRFLREGCVKKGGLIMGRRYCTAYISCTESWQPVHTPVHKSPSALRGMKIETEIFPAGTDIRFLREAGIPALGFSPMNNTPILLHDHNEFLNENVFMKGIDIYCEIIPAVANV